MDKKPKLELTFIPDEILDSYVIIPRDLNQLDNTLQNCKTFFKDEEQSLKCYEESLYSEERVIPSAPLLEH